MIAAESEPLNKNLSDLGLALQPQLEAYSAGQETVSRQLNLMNERFARETSGFNAGSQAELNALSAKIARKQSLTDAEWARANQLADQERQFKQDMAKIGARDQVKCLRYEWVPCLCKESRSEHRSRW